jgi:hypothetical protein
VIKEGIGLLDMAQNVVRECDNKVPEYHKSIQLPARGQRPVDAKKR